MTINTTEAELLWHCFLHFYGLDVSNAAIHTAPVRFSPITFRIQEHLNFTTYRSEPPVVAVRAANGLYEEDKGR